MSLARLPIYLSQLVDAAVASGTGSGSLDYTASAVGKRYPAATTAGSLAYVGAASGKRVAKATGAGTVLTTSSAVGATTRRGVGSGALAYAATATGKRTPKSSATGAVAFIGSATGRRTPKATASGAYAFAGSSTGRRAPKATGLGVLAVTGLATGTRPAVASRTGSGTGARAYLGVGNGWRDPLATGTGTQLRAGTALGFTPLAASDPAPPLEEGPPPMALSTATITFDIADLLGNDFDPRRTKVWVTTNIPGDAIIDTAGDKIRLGSGNVTVGADGTGSIVVWVPGAGSNPDSWQTTVHVDYPDRNERNGRGVKDFGPFTVTANANLADLVAEMPVQPDYLTTVLGTVQDMIDAALEGYTPDGGGSSALVIVSAGGTINLDNTKPEGYSVVYRFTGSATVEGTPLSVGYYAFVRDDDSSSGWSYFELDPPSELAPYVDPDPGGGTTEVTPQQPTWNDSLANYTIANTTGVQYKKGGTNIAAGTYSATSAEAVTIAAVPKTGYVFPTGVATSWSHTFPTVSAWTTAFSDTLLTPTGRITARTGWTVTNDTNSPNDIAIDASGVWLTGSTSLLRTNADSLKHDETIEYDLSEAGVGINRIFVDVARGYQPHRHILRREDSTTVRLELWYHSTLGGGDTIYIPGLPLSGTFRAESDGTYVFAYVNGTKVAEAPHDPSLLGGYSPVSSSIILNGEANTSTKTRAKNFVMRTKA